MNNNSPKKKNELGELWKSAGLLFNIGYYICAALLISMAIGYYADQFFGTKPFLLLLFIFIGILTGLSEIFNVVKKIK
ncbi:MAG: AtpZ/AtpI family protein [Candidatus Wallbacteria bacterium]